MTTTGDKASSWSPTVKWSLNSPSKQTSHQTLTVVSRKFVAQIVALKKP